MEYTCMWEEGCVHVGEGGGREDGGRVCVCTCGGGRVCLHACGSGRRGDGGGCVCVCVCAHVEREGCVCAHMGVAGKSERKEKEKEVVR